MKTQALSLHAPLPAPPLPPNDFFSASFLDGFRKKAFEEQKLDGEEQNKEYLKCQFLFSKRKIRKKKLLQILRHLFVCVFSISLMIHVVYVCVRCHSPIYHEIKLF
ncbi:hypothetical protein OUZ56_007298 [Daphnia magna]|uniref:Transmembrane protein n=1 Tax=Daphnia magna TaxID=35525 RepID=A0ABQ9YYN8_9CRUS|nr:hypothetical protein OUZ56_007298 [Daphnia magna]